MKDPVKRLEKRRLAKRLLRISDGRLEGLGRRALPQELVASLEAIAQKRGMSFAEVAREAFRLLLGAVDGD